MRVRTALALMLLAAPACAQDGDAVPPEVLDLFPRGIESCYAAHATSSSMKAGQTLTDFYLYRLFDPDPATESVDFKRREAIAFDKLTGNGSWTTVMARFRDTKHIYTQTVSCSVWDGIPGKVTCGVDCDGGYFALKRGSDGIAFSFPPDSGGLSLNASCGEPDGESADRWMKPEEAGAISVLQPASASACAEAEQLVRASYGGDPVSLRERIETEGWRCLKRVYDKAHLKSHPNQSVTAMAVAINGPAVVDRTSDSYNYTHLDVVVSLRLRDGTVRKARSVCGALDYELGCEGGFRLRRRDGQSALLVAGDYDSEDGAAPVMLETQLGTDDKLFRLDAMTAADCALE